MPYLPAFVVWMLATLLLYLAALRQSQRLSRRMP
jgi:hypothetical protein